MDRETKDFVESVVFVALIVMVCIGSLFSGAYLMQNNDWKNKQLSVDKLRDKVEFKVKLNSKDLKELLK